MAAPELFSEKEQQFLQALRDAEIDFMVVGLAAAALQGAPAVTQDIDLWFKDRGDAKLQAALKRCGVTYIPPSNENPPLLAGEAAELFDIVVHLHGLGSFDEESRDAKLIAIGSLTIPVLPLARIIASKQATGRPKDIAILPALQAALRVTEAGE